MTTNDADRSVSDGRPGDSETATDRSLVEQATDGSAVITRARQLGKAGVTFVQESALYRWLTAEPDPEVIVIDLRETWTVGPFIALLDRLVEAVTTGGASSRFVGAGQRVAVQTRETPLRVGGSLVVVVGVGAVLTALAGGEVRLGRLLVGILTLVLGVVGVRDDRSIATLRETRVGEVLARGGAVVVRALEPPEPPAERTADAHDAGVSDEGTQASSAEEESDEAETQSDLS